MKLLTALALYIFLFSFGTHQAVAQPKDYSNIIELFRSSPVVEKFFAASYGYAVFPLIGKAGFVVDGQKFTFHPL